MYPKVLIISETFKSKSGGGITLSNLFRGYPVDKLANAIDAVFIPEIESDDICRNFYSLGKEERKILPMFSFLHGSYYSGKYLFKLNQKKTNVSIRKNKFKLVLKKIINPVFEYLGINHILFHYELSNSFKMWLQEFKPDVIYSQLSNIEIMNFTLLIKEFTGAKLAIHIMDDWPSTIGRGQLAGSYWNKKSDKLFREVITQSDLLLSISEGMSDEYFNRYGKTFIPFHNPIKIDLWKSFTKKDFQINKENINILYAGRIGQGISESLITCAKTIEKLKNDGANVSLNIQTTSLDSLLIKILNEFSCVKVNPVVPYSELPSIFAHADILLMPIDFSKKGINFLKFSMPTKASEYMISGTPVLLFCSNEVSLYQHAAKYKWAYCVKENNEQVLYDAIKFLLENENERKKISETAVRFAENHFDDIIVSSDFRESFSKLMQ